MSPSKRKPVGSQQTAAGSSREVNFDGLVGPSHNYAGLSLGNIASGINAGSVSHPRAAALAGLAKMHRLMELGVAQGFLLPHQRPNLSALHALGFRGAPEHMCANAWRSDPALFINLLSASPMWTANAATVSPSADTADRRLHVTAANLASMLHRSLEAEFTYRQLRALFSDDRFFAVHRPIPGGVHLGDEGAANHARLATHHGADGIELFVYNEHGSRFPGRQRRRASEAVARLHGLSAERTVFAQQSLKAVDAGAFHNDVMCLTNESVMLVHEFAFDQQAHILAEIRSKFPGLKLIEVPDSAVPLAEVVASYLFNSQLVTIGCHSRMALVLPNEVKDHAKANDFVRAIVSEDNPISSAVFVDVRESMRNGGGPACLRLRALLAHDEMKAVDERFLLDEDRLRSIERIVDATYPEEVSVDSLGDPAFHRQCFEALDALGTQLGFNDLYRSL